MGSAASTSPEEGDFNGAALQFIRDGHPCGFVRFNISVTETKNLFSPQRGGTCSRVDWHLKCTAEDRPSPAARWHSLGTNKCSQRRQTHLKASAEIGRGWVAAYEGVSADMVAQCFFTSELWTFTFEILCGTHWSCNLIHLDCKGYAIELKTDRTQSIAFGNQIKWNI